MIDKIVKEIAKLFFQIILFLVKTPYKIWKSRRDYLKAHPSMKTHLNEWKEIQRLTATNKVPELKMALIQADKSIDNLLREKVEGETMGDRLIKSKEIFKIKTYNEVWSAHKVRNSMVHESGFNPPISVLKKSISDLKKGAKDIGVPLL